MAIFQKRIFLGIALLLVVVLADLVAQAQDEPANQRAVLNPGLGGGAQADFDSLIDLIQSTIAPTTWDDVGGEGSIMGFPGGVFVDASGVLQKLDSRIAGKLAPAWDAASIQARRSTEGLDLGRPSKLRKVSLKRLEAELKRLAADGQPATVPMRLLAGLNRIDYLMVDEASGDVIIAGPAGPWTLDRQGRIVDRQSLRPVLRLDDWVVILRNAFLGSDQFVCSITPTEDRLQKTQAYLRETSRRPLKPGGREQWLNGLRAALGNQRIEVEGIAPETRVARVLVEADYHMKLVGIGLEPGTDQIVSYLDSIELAPGESPPEMGVLRWWFTLQDDMIVRNQDGTGFRLAPQVVRVLSENELLTEQGQRVHTGTSDDLNRRFARSFTKDFRRLAVRYPIYAELDNVFRWAVVAAVLKHEDIPGQLAWDMAHWLGQEYSVPTGRIPQEVQSVINHRVVNRKHVIAAVSGGVSFRSQDLYATGFKTGTYKIADIERPRKSSPKPTESWWWD